MYCPYCGTKNAEENLFCQNCGKNLRELSTNVVNRNSENTNFNEGKQKENITLTIPNPVNYLESSGFSIWGPFAGLGNRRDHKGWLIPGRVDSEDELIKMIKDKFSERKIPGSSLASKTLSVKGVLEEKRPYFLLSRGVATVAVYVSGFGKDLFVSIASYLKPQISKFCVILWSLISIIAIFGTIWWVTRLWTSLAGSLDIFSSSSSAVEDVLWLTCIAGPIISLSQFVLSIFIFVSIYKFIKEKDILALLRMSTHEFNEDDLMAMEKAVEQTVRISLDEIGIPAEEFIPIVKEDRRRII